jgi:hypothetical protein
LGRKTVNKIPLEHEANEKLRKQIERANDPLKKAIELNLTSVEYLRKVFRGDSRKKLEFALLGIGFGVHCLSVYQWVHTLL